MQFISTQGKAPAVGFATAFINGLAPDGGLYLPEKFASIQALLENPETPYPELAFKFLRLFDDDHAPDELRALVERSHENFEDPNNAAPLRQLDDNLFLLELFHGPTLAFKDFGLQLVGNLFEDQIARTGNPINVLGATSGDTGSAAIHGLAGKESVNVFILYPKGRISELQERQMTCTGATNIFPIRIDGTFDDAQDIVKSLFNDADFKAKRSLSAVNSINIARILAQSIYYLHASRNLPTANTSDLNFVVPTGNFGNIFAGWLAKRNGLAADRFTIATNQNDILYRLFTTGIYSPGEVHPSLAPSMDIQVASNFERFLYYALEGDTGGVTEMMTAMKSQGTLEIPNFDPGIFSSTRTDDDGILEIIRRAHSKYDVILDPHTACGFAEVDPARNTVVLSTAHPAKFPDTIEKALGITPTHPVLEALKEKPPSPGISPPILQPRAVSKLCEDRSATISTPTRLDADAEPVHLFPTSHPVPASVNH